MKDYRIITYVGVLGVMILGAPTIAKMDTILPRGSLLKESEIQTPLPTELSNKVKCEINDFSRHLSYLKYLDGDISTKEYQLHETAALQPNFTSQLYVDYSNIFDTRWGETKEEIEILDNTLESKRQTYTLLESSVPDFATFIIKNTEPSMYQANIQLPAYWGNKKAPVYIEHNLCGENRNILNKKISRKIPVQQVTVPKGLKYKVEWVVDEHIISGKYNISSRINANIEYGSSSKAMPIGVALDEELRLNKKFHHLKNLDDNNIRISWDKINDDLVKRIWTKGDITISYRKKLRLRVTDITSPITHVVAEKSIEE
ncbi:hypothetical protein [Lactococcus garvieae]|uniref:hypothetical protein n=1 Tax=Lactococcus garvieae TaxID=1363 RepID=UPI0038551147